MVDLQGFWLNLDRCQERAFWMRNRLGALSLSEKYQRIAGVEGDVSQAVSRGLKPGEWGAWQGWIRMLDRASQSSAAVVHLVEDDVDILDRSLVWLRMICCLALWFAGILSARMCMFLLANV